jgi:hypothetical protein
MHELGNTSFCSCPLTSSLLTSSVPTKNCALGVPRLRAVLIFKTVGADRRSYSAKASQTGHGIRRIRMSWIVPFVAKKVFWQTLHR